MGLLQIAFMFQNFLKQHGLLWTHALAETPHCESPSASPGGFHPGWVDRVPTAGGTYTGGRG